VTAKLGYKEENFNVRQDGSYHMEERYSNGYGIDVVCNPGEGFWSGSYGGKEGLLELAVIEDRPDTDSYFPREWPLCYTTPITGDVIGWLDFKDVEEISRRIKELPTISRGERVYRHNHRFDWVEEEEDDQP
jgi:hypothetical protein